MTDTQRHMESLFAEFPADLLSTVLRIMDRGGPYLEMVDDILSAVDSWGRAEINKIKAESGSKVRIFNSMETSELQEHLHNVDKRTERVKLAASKSMQSIQERLSKVLSDIESRSVETENEIRAKYQTHYATAEAEMSDRMDAVTKRLAELIRIVEALDHDQVAALLEEVDD